jgi:hypothetical protein
MSALPQKRSFDPGRPNVRFAPEADIQNTSRLPSAIEIDGAGAYADRAVLLMTLCDWNCDNGIEG